MGYEKGMRRTREGYEKWGAFSSYLNDFSVCQRTLLERFGKVRAGQFVPLSECKDTTAALRSTNDCENFFVSHSVRLLSSSLRHKGAFCALQCYSATVQKMVVTKPKNNSISIYLYIYIDI